MLFLFCLPSLQPYLASTLGFHFLIPCGRSCFWQPIWRPLNDIYFWVLPVDTKMAMDPMFLATSFFRRRKFDECIEVCTNLLVKNPYDQVQFCCSRQSSLPSFPKSVTHQSYHRRYSVYGNVLAFRCPLVVHPVRLNMRISITHRLPIAETPPWKDVLFFLLLIHFCI